MSCLFHRLWAIVASVSLLAVTSPSAAQHQVIDLNGDWYFALDPVDEGEQYGWNSVPENWDGMAPIASEKWDTVTVPHDFLSDPRYEWTGTVWYRKSIQVPDGGDEAVYRLQFERVATKCDVWVNGKKMGSHQGAYTPFELDISQVVRPGRYNHLAISVSNRREIGDIPGPRLATDSHNQIVAWLNYGGILAPARLAISSPVYVVNQKVDANPVLPEGSAELTITALLRNGSSKPKSVKVGCAVSRDGEPSKAIQNGIPQQIIEINAKDQVSVEFRCALAKENVDLWSPDTPELYISKISVASEGGKNHSRSNTFGIRTIEVKGTRLLLNGEQIRLAGANRVEGHPETGALEPPEIVDLDMGLMKRAHLEMHRLQHYPVSQQMLDWADRHGMLIVCEAPCWNLHPAELSDARYRSNFTAQFTEMIQSSWNHPSVIAWSVGNEYESWTAEGVDWTRTFAALAKQLDETRPTTFPAVNHAPGQDAPSLERRSMHWVDFISLNQYSSVDTAARNLDLIHQRWPNKPVMLTEFGRRIDQVSAEQRIQHFQGMLKVVRDREFVAGMSYWSFNDYRSRYPGTNANGYRPWGIVGPNREPRSLYYTMKQELAPAFIKIIQKEPLVVEVQARQEFPSMTLRNYLVRAIDSEAQQLGRTTVPTLKPGDSTLIELDVVGGARVQLVRPTGFVSTEIGI
ncbi:MAG: glycoside hydrolase family 2 TIM barrel-domain containing protein [Planctomycetota bacterium]